MQFGTHALIGAAASLPLGDPSSVLSLSPITLPFEDREVDMQLRLTIPGEGNNTLPIILLAHGLGTSNWLSSLDGYQPMAEFYASQGFVVIQPTFLTSSFLDLAGTIDQGVLWESPAHDLVRVLDSLDEIERSWSAVKGRLDRDRIAVVGHSLGGWTASMLMGATNTDPRTNVTLKIDEPRIKAGIAISPPGLGGTSLSETGQLVAVSYGPDFSTMTKPGLVVYGDTDYDFTQHLTHRGPDWHADSYHRSPSPKDLFAVRHGMHSVGGVSGPDTFEGIGDESPERLASVQRVTASWLKSRLYDADSAWEDVVATLTEIGSLGSIVSK